MVLTDIGVAAQGLSFEIGITEVTHNPKVPVAPLYPQTLIKTVVPGVKLNALICGIKPVPPSSSQAT